MERDADAHHSGPQNDHISARAHPAQSPFRDLARF